MWFGIANPKGPLSFLWLHSAKPCGFFNGVTMQVDFKEKDGEVTLVITPDYEYERAACVLFERHSREERALYNVEFDYNRGDSNG